MPNSHHLILGGARSGKSRFSEELALQLCAKPLYVATAQPLDKEMDDRINIHQARREPNWGLIEETLYLGDVISENTSAPVILIDCLTLWLTNCLTEDCWLEQRQKLIDSLENTPSTIIMVSNEVGSGVVPMGELTRKFVDQLGWLHQDLGAICGNVSLMIAGIEHRLKAQTK